MALTTPELTRNERFILSTNSDYASGGIFRRCTEQKALRQIERAAIIRRRTAVVQELLGYAAPRASLAAAPAPLLPRYSSEEQEEATD